MNSDWTPTRCADFIEFNPRLNLKKGTVATKIAMDKLRPFTKKIQESERAAFSGGAKFANGDTIMARITPCLENGKTAFVDCLAEGEIAFGSTEFIVLRAKRGISDARFLYYLATSSDFRDVAIKSMVGTSGRQRVQQSVLEEWTTSLPPLETQRKIAAVLSALDDKIELNRRINANLAQQATAIYAKFFPYETTDALPEGWRVGTVGEIVEIHDSKRVPLSSAQRIKMTNKKFPYYGAASLMDYVEDYLFDGKYLLLGEDGTVVDAKGRPILQYVWGKFWVNNHAHVLTGKLGFNVESLMLLFKQTYVKPIVTGAVQPKISQANLRSLPIVVPPVETLDDFNDKIAALFTQFRVNEEQNKVLAAVRDALTPRLMSGEIDVADVAL